MTGGSNKLRLGTRGSLLAIAQSRAVASQLQQRHPDLDIELVVLQTRGDHDQQTPLQQVNDPGFFSDEIDTALVRHEIDFAVHSRKDLEESRPEELVCAAIPPRENPRDVVIFRADVRRRLNRGLPLRIGSSSLRRQTNVAGFLRDHLPRSTAASDPVLEFSALRGPVDQRLQRIHGDPGSDGALDGIVLALAGLNRLWSDPPARQVCAALLTDVMWMVLPLTHCPAAPGQGALALECRRDDVLTRTRLSALHDPLTATLLEMEFSALAGQADEQRDGFGATAIEAGSLGRLLFTRGADDPVRSRLHWQRPPSPSNARAWHASEFKPQRHRLPLPADAFDASALFVAHRDALRDVIPPARPPRTWVSGSPSWQSLARAGWWVEGCAEQLGFAHIEATLSCPALQLPPLPAWTAITRAGAEASWRASNVGRVLAAYRLECVEPGAQELDRLREATHIFWSSSAWLQRLYPQLPPGARHACGNGKTAGALQALGIEPTVFPSREEWQSWLG